MRNLLNVVEIFMYGLAVYNLVGIHPERYWLYFGIGLVISFVKKFFKRK